MEAVDPAAMAPQETPSIAPSPAEPGPESRDIIGDLKKAQRKRILIAIGAIVLMGAIGFGVWYTQRSLLPAPPERALENARKGLGAFEQIPKDMWPLAAADTLSELEENRLPKALRDSMNLAGQSAQYGMGSGIALGPIAEGQMKSEWLAVCANGHQVLADMIAKPPAEQGRFLYETCNLSRYKFLGADEASRADGPMLALAYLAYEILVSNRALLPEEETLLRYFTQDTVLLRGRSNRMTFR